MSPLSYRPAPKQMDSPALSTRAEFSLSRWKRTVRLGFKSLWLHRLRSLLTVLGIVFGVCSVIAMLAIGEGASFEAQEQIKNLGSQNIILRSVKPPEKQKISDKNSQSFVLQYGITYADARRLQRTIPSVTVLVPARIMHEYVSNISRRIDCDIVATVTWYLQMRNQHLEKGRFFTDTEMDDRVNVCILAAATAQKLFPLESAVGSCVRVGSDYYRVIGILQGSARSNSASDAAANDLSVSPNAMFIPLDTARTRFGDNLVKFRSGSVEAERVELHEITVQVKSQAGVVPASEAIREVMDRNHPQKDYAMIVPLELLKRAERTKEIFNVVLGSIAAISLLVGGIGIMNIMLASITERTREIGIRRALGARRRDIIIQFLVETVILSGTGGLIGVILGMVIPWLVTLFAHMKTIIAFYSPLIAFSVSALVGVVFGIYPALRAASMDPVEALRHE